MASLHHRSSVAALQPFRMPTLLLLLLTLLCAEAQGPPGPTGNGAPKLNTFTPSSAIVIVVLVTTFFFLAFFSVYIRQCTSVGRGRTAPAPAAAGRSRRQRGLDPAVLATFPTLAYSDAKALKMGKSALECAVCLSEFEDDETLQLLPPCSHVFHPDCIAAWLANHVTCPVCRADLARAPTSDPEATGEDESVDADAERQPADSFVVAVNETETPEVEELARIRSERRAARIPRSRSTVDAATRPADAAEEAEERYTLRLPEGVRREVVEAARLRRAKSCAAAGEGSARRWWRWGGGGGGGGRSARLGRSDRWPSVLARTISARVPTWASGRRGGGGEGDGSARGKVGAAVAPAAFAAASASAGDPLARV